MPRHHNPSLLPYARAHRKRPTATEDLFWRALRNGRFGGLKFRREHPVLDYIADFCCLEQSVIIEIDGSIHNLDSIREHDPIRQRRLEEAGYRIIRFTADEVYLDLGGTLEKLGKLMGVDYKR